MNKLMTAIVMSGAATLVAGAWPAIGAETVLRLDFITHAAFFSAETKQEKTIDPQVFVRDPAVAAATGPQNIEHVAGLRPALVQIDPDSTPVFTAINEPLGFSLGEWLDAKGTVEIVPGSDGGGTLTASFIGLEPGGSYSLFENQFDETPVGFKPIDGMGTENNFVAGADGAAAVSFEIPHVPTHANAVLLVYHSDGEDHGVERGPIGVLAHHQLIARPE